MLHAGGCPKICQGEEISWTLVRKDFQTLPKLTDDLMSEERLSKEKLTPCLITPILNCAAAIDHLGYRYGLDAVYTLESIVRLLSRQLRSRWTKEVEHIGRGHREADFEDLKCYLYRQTRIANNKFGH